MFYSHSQGDARLPLNLLHRVLSSGVHELDDNECLGRAQVVQVVLTESVLKMVHISKHVGQVEASAKGWLTSAGHAWQETPGQVVQEGPLSSSLRAGRA